MAEIIDQDKSKANKQTPAEAGSKSPDKADTKKGNTADVQKDKTTPVTEIKGEVKSFLKDVKVKDILLRNSPVLYNIQNEISSLKRLREDALSEKIRIKHLLAPVKRGVKKLQGAPVNKPSKEQRKTLRNELGQIDSLLITIDSELEIRYDKLTQVSFEETQKLALQQLRDKSESLAYVKKNGYFITQKVLGSLNGILGSDDEIRRASFERVRKLAFIEGEEGIKEFNQALAELLNNTDEKTYILSSGKLRNKLYSAVRLTLQNWNVQEKSIAKLLFPDDLAGDIKSAPDPFEKNKALITSLILKHFNQTIKVNKDGVISLRNLAKDINQSDEFQNKLNDFIDNEDSDLFMIGAGGLRQRLNETLRLTLVNWQPELQMNIEEVVITKAVN